jgi:uncharacterized protein (TIGR02145 family)
MNLKGEKRGMSTIVATLIIIMLVLVAAGVVWATVSNVVYKSSEQINLGKFTVDLKVENPQVMCNSLNITVKRNSGEGSFVGIAFVFEGKDSSETIKEYVSMEELEERSFAFTLNTLTSENITGVKVYPIFRLESGKEVFGNSKGKYTFSDSDILECPISTSLNIVINSTVFLNDCEILDVSNTRYILEKSITTDETCFNITADDLLLDLNGFTITGDNSGADYGVYALGRNKIIIRNGFIEWFGKSSANIGDGIYLINTNNSAIENIDASNNGYGIEIISSSSNNLKNIGVSSSYWEGLTLDSSSGSTLSNIVGVSNGGAGIYLYSSNNSILTNLSSSKESGIILERSSNNILNNINSSNNTLGLFVYATSNNNIFSNIITSFNGPGAQAYGIYVSQCTGNVFNNVISSSNKDLGIQLSLSPQTTFNNVTISDNEVYNTITGGLYLYNNNNSIFNNLNCYNNARNQIKANGWSININNTLNYNNSFGEIKLQALNSNINGTLRFGEGYNVNIGNNFAFINPSGDLIGLNIPANITLKDTGVIGGIILKDGAACGSSCHILNVSGTTYAFSVPGAGNYSISSIAMGYGLLYNWYAVNDTRGLCPTGWHVPTKGEWATLETYLGGLNTAGGRLKETDTIHWYSPNTAATNDVGFNGLPGGLRSTYFNPLSGIGRQAFWWSATQANNPPYPNSAESRGCQYTTTTLHLGTFSKYYGESIRCLRNTSVGWVEGEQITDYDGNVYDTVQIGTQIWMVQNLAVTHYRNGNVIPEVTNNAAWAALTTGALCAYNNDWGYVYGGRCTVSGCGLQAPIALAATNLTHSSFFANWGGEVSLPTGYSLDVATDNGFTNLVVNNLNVGHVLSYNVTGLLAGNSYYYRIRAYNDSYTSDNSDIISITLPISGFGLLYNWYTVNDSRNIANTGWHVPSNVELTTLQTYLGGWTIAGGKLKETGFIYWNDPNIGATNEVGFNLRGAGYRFNGYYVSFKGTTMIRSSVKSNPNSYVGLSLNNGQQFEIGDSYNDNYGCSVRLIRDSTTCSNGETGSYTGNNGKVYRTICIGNQEWLADNLAETKYRNGDTIPEVTDNTAWTGLTTGALCAYNNDWSYV